MSAGRGWPVASTPALTITGLGPGTTLTVHGRDAALVLRLVESLAELRGRACGELRLSFNEGRVKATVAWPVQTVGGQLPR